MASPSLRNSKPSKSEQRKALLDTLNGGSLLKANAAARDIWKAGDPAYLLGILRVLRHGRRLHNRVEAAYALGAITGVKGTGTLEKVLSNRSENPRLRAFVAETLAHRHRPSSHNVLLRNVTDPSREVRFWCAFALGQMRERKALPLLRVLAERDHRVVRGWWTVSKEAADAIANITRRKGWGIRFCPLCR
jgi:HEAT repeat protein